MSSTPFSTPLTSIAPFSSSFYPPCCLGKWPGSFPSTQLIANTNVALFSFLRTTCNVLCIGKVIPAIGRKFPNSTVDVHLHTLRPPKARTHTLLSLPAGMDATPIFPEIHPSGALLGALVMADVYASPIGENPIDAGKIFSVRLRFG